MNKQLAIATVAIMLTAVLLAPPVMASALRGDKTIDVGGKQLRVIELKENSIEGSIGGKEVIHIRRFSFLVRLFHFFDSTVFILEEKRRRDKQCMKQG